MAEARSRLQTLSCVCARVCHLLRANHTNARQQSGCYHVRRRPHLSHRNTDECISLPIYGRSIFSLNTGILQWRVNWSTACSRRTTAHRCHYIFVRLIYSRFSYLPINSGTNGIFVCVLKAYVTLEPCRICISHIRVIRIFVTTTTIRIRLNREWEMDRRAWMRCRPMAATKSSISWTKFTARIFLCERRTSSGAYIVQFKW